ncbi:MAG: hypothetical protein H0U74_19695 [Bradymonadaceae bacterium]|nr:hypothetical protein [Lujinxingiaceae bacterium]
MSPNKCSFFLPIIFIALLTACSSDPDTRPVPTNNTNNTNNTEQDVGDLDLGGDADDQDATTEPDAATDADPDSGPVVECATAEECTERPGSEASCSDQGACVYSCEEGFVDVDGIEATGCECELTATEDNPDSPDGTDTNCDGVDGIAEHNVYVTATGDDAAAGTTPDAAFATLAKAIEFAAATEGRTTILVSAGEFNESITLASGISLYGGYDADWSLGTSRTVLIADATETDTNVATLTAAGIDAATIVSGFEIRGADHSATPGASTYALRVSDSPDELLQFVNSQIVAGKAGHGENGVAGAAALTSATGENASGTTAGKGGTSACSSLGGRGGAATTCASTTGESGSNGQTGGTQDRNDGDGGAGAANRCGTITCVVDNPSVNGVAGQNGGAGDHGAGGEAGTQAQGYFVDGNWQAAASVPAETGENGNGGGGGGAGRSDFCTAPVGGGPTGDGGGGGGGGGGGCAGNAGTNGFAGGSAIAVVLINSVVSLTTTQILLGAAGNGGDGGAGSAGSEGQAGGHGQIRAAAEFGNGGNGGLGGNGGHGGGGAGACGGSSIGLALVGDSEAPVDVTYTTGNAAVAGTGGLGGSSEGNAGEAGCTGVLSHTATY